MPEMQRSILAARAAKSVNGHAETHGVNGDTEAKGTNGDFRTNGNSSGAVTLELDAAIVGGGFAGVYLMHRLRQEGFDVKLVEAGSGLGGIWHWNNYPGARVDSKYPVYALDIPEIYETWEWSEQYPSAPELQRYFHHVDKILDISKDTLYNTRVHTARWDDETHKWQVSCDNGTEITARFLHGCLGFASKRHFPDWPGLDTFGGHMCHSSFWPAEGINVRGKKVGVIGTGATGVQIAQTTARDAEQLTVFVRTPNTCMPMRQQPLTRETIDNDRAGLKQLLGTDRYKNSSGFLYPDSEKNLVDDSPEEIERTLQNAWQVGGFAVLFVYKDLLLNPEANRVVYDFWARSTRKRISDPVKRDILAPLEPLHPFAGKRVSLEQDYYEQMDKPNVKLVDLKQVDITRVVPQGIVTSDGVTHELDMIAIATGFDSLTGSFTQIDIRGIDNQSLSETWNTQRGALTYLGMAVHGFPNFFFTNGPHSPTFYNNGPSLVQPQGEWIVDMMTSMRANGQTKINAQLQAQEDWKKLTNELHSVSLRHKVDSWYTGANIPGKPRQVLSYDGGLPRYLETIRGKATNGYNGFDLS
ncbi:cyclopentanone 1,2-monooxygenase [Metarhizium brunneum]